MLYNAAVHCDCEMGAKAEGKKEGVSDKAVGDRNLLSSGLHCHIINIHLEA